MNFLAIYTLIISTAQKFVSGGEVTYYADCKPPDGFTSGTYSTSSLLPIEKCCPQTDPCDEIQGYCTLKWALDLWPRMCDHMTYDCKDFQCVCCVKCSEDKCSKCTETRGECKKECRPDEVEDHANPCSFAKCKCCKKCDIQPECQNAGGKCVGAYDDCPIGSFGSNTGCCGGCFCCKPACQPLPACSQVEGAYCSETEHCAGGFYGCHGLCQKTKWKGGYEAIEKCYCCVPKWNGDYLLICPDDNISTKVSTPEYKVPDKGGFGQPNWSTTDLESFNQSQLTTEESTNITQETTGENIIITQLTTEESPNTTQSTLSSTELLAIDTSNAGGGGFLIPISPLRDTAEKVNKAEKVQIISEKIVKKVQANEMKNEKSNKSILVPDEGKANKKDFEINQLSSESTNKKSKVNKEKTNFINGNGNDIALNNNINKYHALQTDKQSKGKATTPDQKEILDAINLLKKLLFKKKARKNNSNPNERKLSMTKK